MALSTSSFKSESSCTNNGSTVVGCSLKKGQLKRWIYENHHTQPFVARKLNLSVEEFKRMLSNHELFNREQVKALIELLGANEAYKVIYFPTKEERKRVYERTFGI